MQSDTGTGNSLGALGFRVVGPPHGGQMINYKGVACQYYIGAVPTRCLVGRHSSFVSDSLACYRNVFIFILYIFVLGIIVFFSFYRESGMYM